MRVPPIDSGIRASQFLNELPRIQVRKHRVAIKRTQREVHTQIDECVGEDKHLCSAAISRYLVPYGEASRTVIKVQTANNVVQKPVPSESINSF